MIIAIENEVDVEKEIKKLKSSKSKTYLRKSGKDCDKSRHPFKGDYHEPIYIALARKDNSDRYIPFLFSLKSVNAFALFKTNVLRANFCK